MDRTPNTAVYVISVAAELAGVHPQTLRIYERKGLVEPARTGGGSRRYSEADIALLRKIQLLTDAGLNLSGVKRVLDLEAEVERLQGEITRLAAENRQVEAQLESLRAPQPGSGGDHRVDPDAGSDVVPVRATLAVYRKG